MTESQKNFRNNSLKCVFNKYGFCRFKLECRKQHAQNVCSNENCDTKCDERHPKPCRNKDKCRFLKTKSCAFSHEAFENENDEANEQAKFKNNEIRDLENLLMKNNAVCESKVKSLKDAIENERKKNKDHEDSLKDEIKKKNELERNLKKELKDLNLKMKEIESSNKGLELKVVEIERSQITILNQNEVINEMLTKEFFFELKLMQLEAKHKIYIDELKEEIYILKNNAVSTSINHAEEASNIVVEELKGRNITIIKTKKNLPEITSSRDEENKVTNKIETVEKPKPKRTKITKKVIEERLIAAYVFDAELMLEDLETSQIEGVTQTCKKCEFETHSEGIFKRHKVLIHDSGKETNQSIILGFEADVQRHYKVLEKKGKSLENFKCEECDYKIYSSGKLTLHKLTTHQG